MRITDKIVQKRMLRSLQKATERLTKTQERIATKRNIKRPSDDPIGFMRIMSYQRDLHRLRQTIRNAESASTMLLQGDTVLQQAGDLMLDARNEAAAMSTDAADEDQRLAVANGIQLMIDAMLQKANTKLGGRYIFSGHKIFTQPYQEVDGQIEYVGDQGRIEKRIELSGSLAVSIPGSEIFGSSDSGVLKVLTDLKDALETDDGASIRDTLSLIDAGIDRIAGVRGAVGIKIKRVEASISELHIMELSLTNELSQVEEVDTVMEAGEYMANQEAYQAALEITASTLRLPSLLDYLS